MADLSHDTDDARDDAPDVRARLAAGDEAALRVLFDATHDALVRYAASLVRDAALADDVVQEAFVRLWDRRDRLDETLSLRAWLFRTVRNLALNAVRDDRTRRRLLDDPTAVETAAAPRALPLPGEGLAAAELDERLARFVEELPPRQREALQLSRVEGLSHAEVAAAMACSPRTVNNHLVAALATLRRRLAEIGTLVASLAGIVS